MARNGFDEVEARRRIAAQPPQAEKVVRADVVIDNSGTLEETRAQVDDVADLSHAAARPSPARGG